MFTLEVEYLMGRVLASTRDDRSTVEWPPHPARMFAALVAAYEECNLGDDARAALEWLEALPEPGIYADPPEHEGWVRDVPSVWIPVNDSNDQLNPTTKKPYQSLSQEIGLRRNRQERWFPAFTPRDRHVWFIWNDASDARRYTPALQRIAENVTYLGHSMSPVRVYVGSTPPEPTLIPDNAGTIMLRTTGRGRLQHLEETFKLRLENTTIQPRLGRVSHYRIVSEETLQRPATLFRHGFVFRRLKGTNLPLEGAARLVATVRKAVMDRYPNPVPEVISGHDDTGNPARLPHLTIAPLADVGHRHADGHIMGFALWLPQDVPIEVVETFEDALSDFESLLLGRQGIWEVGRIDAEVAARGAAARGCAPTPVPMTHGRVSHR
jgi:CRISPR-associated protein Csb2